MKLEIIHKKSESVGGASSLSDCVLRLSFDLGIDELSELYCQNSYGFEGPEAFSDCGECVVGWINWEHWETVNKEFGPCRLEKGKEI